MTYFTADLHLGHNNIIASCGRPFSDVDEMNRTIIDNWNSRVTDRDDVWVLGDVAYKSAEHVGTFLSRMKGRKHLVLGNHDRSWMKTLDASEYFVSIEQMSFLSLEGRNIILCHYPMMEWDGSHHGSYLIYGHIHGNCGQSFWPLISSNDHMLNAGVDINGFYPVTFPELVENNRRFKEMVALGENPGVTGDHDD